MIRKARLATLVVIAIATGTHAGLFAIGMVDDEAFPVGFVITGAAIAAAVHRASRADTLQSASTRAALGTMAACAIAAPFVWLVARILAGRSTGDALFAFLAGPVIGALLGAPAGIAVAVPTVALVRETLRPTACTPSMIGATLGAWSAGMIVLLALYRELVWEGTSVLAIAAMLAGIVVAALSYGRVRSQQQWLARVRRGEVAGFAIVPAAEIEHSPDLLPFSPDATRDAVLVREIGGEGGEDRRARRSLPSARSARSRAEPAGRALPQGGAYRGASAREPIAFAGLTPSE
ncbi:hypothetical protein [Sandaracinus amylolyticus]|uniref:hypothetical protein n=1 Tax=Sandaracinus amylolyticus TaxID=927083 RepID=UPI001F3CEAC9|nr:hypothetical protein [Sandaracinus amylolyticus]UJR79504.1 Hypothetical protein I5071_15400 [Sandaracinus amylolyticus]